MPIAHRCATKLRLPNVPPGARFKLKYSLLTPYACASDVRAPTTTAAATPLSSGRAFPERRSDAAHQKSAAPAAEIASARSAAHGLVAPNADARPATRNNTIARSTVVSDMRSRRD